MANVKISALPAVTTVVPGSDVLPLVSGGITTKATPNQIVQAVLPAPGDIGSTTAGKGTFSSVFASSASTSYPGSLTDGIMMDYATGTGRITVGASDGFAVYTGGPSSRTFLFGSDSSGNVGIGTSSPTANHRLTIKAPTANYAQVSLIGGDTTNFWSVSAYNDASQFFVGYNNSQKLTLDSSGNLGLGVTPSGWNTSAKAVQISSTSSVYGTSNATLIGQNTYNNTSGNNIYLTSAAASLYQMYGGGHQWFTAASGTAGNAISFTQAMTLDASGNLGIGTSSPNSYGAGYSVVTVNGSSSGIVQATNGTITTEIATFGTIGLVGTRTSHALGFITGGTERARIDSSGYLLVGYASSNGAYKLQVNSQIFATSATIATSDANYKENVTPLIGALELIKKLNPVSFDWKQHQVHAFDTENKMVGFLAQEVQAAMADLPYVNSIVKESEVTLADGEKEKFLGIAEGNMIAILTKAIQELSAELNELKGKIA